MHGAIAPTNDLDGGFKLGRARVRELPLEARHEVLSEWHGNFADQAIVLTVSLARHADALQNALEGGWVSLGLRARGLQQSLHLLGAGRHLTIVRLEDLLEFVSGLLLRLRCTLGLEGALTEEGAKEVSFKHFIKVVIIIDTPKDLLISGSHKFYPTSGFWGFGVLGFWYRFSYSH